MANRKKQIRFLLCPLCHTYRCSKPGFVCVRLEFAEYEKRKAEYEKQGFCVQVMQHRHNVQKCQPCIDELNTGSKDPYQPQNRTNTEGPSWDDAVRTWEG
jgi:hypothetical protein